ncbi:hypothetical protein [Streptomyces sp. NPDC091219]|uniref:hypothetical protein n=1 Tax=Streptomyces sp. NPDC091219 TaxID=3155193 RepID=UPI00344CC3C3
MLLAAATPGYDLPDLRRFHWEEESAGHGRVVITPPPPRKRLTMIQLDEGPLIGGLIRGGPQEKL